MRVAFVGLGNMGLPMALNLSRAGHEVRGFDLTPSVRVKAREAGLAVTESLPEATDRVVAVVTMLPSSEAAEGFYLREACDTLLPGTLLVDCSTIAPEASRRLASAAEARSHQYVEAPVSGGTRAAAEGTLTFLVGGEGRDVERATTLLQAMGKKIFHVGPAGSGQTAKICNNMLLAIQMIGTSEALLLGEANGLSPKLLSEIMMASSGRNWCLEMYNPYPQVMPGAPASRDYEGGFPVELMEKDLRLAQEVASGKRSPTPLGALAHQLFQLHRKQGAARLDFSSILRFLARK